jgi:hypothetical protein
MIKARVQDVDKYPVYGSYQYKQKPESYGV